MDKVVRDSVSCQSQKSKSKGSPAMEQHVSCLFSVESCGGEGGEDWQTSSQLEAENNLLRLREESEMDFLEEENEGILKKDCLSRGGARRTPNSRSSLSSRSRGRCWSLRDIIIVTGAMLLLMLCWCSEVSAKGPEMMPEDDFDSSNKKVKFEDFDTNVTPMQASGGSAVIGGGSGGTNDPQGHHTSDKVARDAAGASSLGFIHAFIASFSVIVVSELGDKTFFIAAIMAMRHSRITVFAGAISALAIMTILSALFGWATTIIPKAITYYISTALFAIFGLKMLYDGFRMSADEGAEELEEVQATLRRRDDDNNDIESQSIKDSSPEPSSGFKLPSSMRRILFTLFSRVYLQALTMTFLAEWGDRSQIATVILAAREDVPGVCIGGILGHSCCTGLAVLGGRMIAQKISVRTVTIIGGIVFLVFAVTSLFFNPDNM